MTALFVAGQPVPQGSKRLVNGRMIEMGKGLGEWRRLVALLCQEQQMTRIDDGPVQVRLDFYFLRPKAHFRANGQVKDSAPRFPATRPDIDKLARAVLDPLTGVAFRDDAQVSSLTVRKYWCENPSQVPGVRISVTPDW